MNNVDIYVRMNAQDNPGQAVIVAQEIACLQGVRKAQAHPKVQRLVAVSYDPQQTTGQAILTCARQKDVSARLVGL